MAFTAPWCACGEERKDVYLSYQSALKALQAIRDQGGHENADGSIWLPQKVYPCSAGAYHLSAGTYGNKNRAARRRRSPMGKIHNTTSAKRRRLVADHANGLHSDQPRARCRACVEGQLGVSDQDSADYLAADSYLVLMTVNREPSTRHYVGPLARATQLPNGRLQAALDSLTKLGWIGSGVDAYDPAKDREPPRRWYMAKVRVT